MNLQKIVEASKLLAKIMKQLRSPRGLKAPPPPDAGLPKPDEQSKFNQGIGRFDIDLGTAPVREVVEILRPVVRVPSTALSPGAKLVRLRNPYQPRASADSHQVDGRKNPHPDGYKKSGNPGRTRAKIPLP